MTIQAMFESVKRYGYVTDAEWKESDHPRDGNGQFTDGGNGRRTSETDEDGDAIRTVKNFDEISENDFLAPKESLKLPPIKSEEWQRKINDSRPVLLKKWRIERNLRGHPEISEKGFRNKDVLLEAVYNPDKILFTQPQKQPNYRAAIRTSKNSEILIEAKNCVAVLDISPNKKYIEVVDWRIIRDKSVREMERQAKRNAVEDGRFLYDSGKSQAQQVDFLSYCILGNNPTVGAVKDYTAATSPKPCKQPHGVLDELPANVRNATALKNTIPDTAPQVKSLPGLLQIIKRL